MRLWPRNNASTNGFSAYAAELTDCARLLDVILFRALHFETRPWPKLSQHDLTRISASTGAGRGARAGAVAGRGTGRHSTGRLRGSVGDRADWRGFEPHADCTVFQSFDWLASWQRHIGVRNGVRPAIVVGRDGAGGILFLLPLSVRAAGFGRELDLARLAISATTTRRCWRPSFAAAVRPRAFPVAVGRTSRRACKAIRACDTMSSVLTKMPEMVGAQPNPMLRPARDDQSERGLFDPSHRRLGNVLRGQAFVGDAPARPHQAQAVAEFGEVKLRQPGERSEIVRTLDTLMEQKARAFARMGVGNLFARPGYARILSRARERSGDPASRPCQPARRRRDVPPPSTSG